jgi:hypothetical protein
VTVVVDMPERRSADRSLQRAFQLYALRISTDELDTEVIVACFNFSRGKLIYRYAEATHIGTHETESKRDVGMGVRTPGSVGCGDPRH